MARKLAAATALVAFAVCVLAGMVQQNTFSTTVSRALMAMVITFVIGLVVGAMAEKMLVENVRREEEKLKELEAKKEAVDR